MKTGDVVTVRLRELRRDLDKLCRRTRKSRSEIIREALSRYLALQKFHELRGKIIPYAERHGYVTDEDVFNDVS